MFTRYSMTTIAGFPALVAAPEGRSKGTVVLLHGAFADQHGFAGWVERLARAGYDTIAPARRGRGGIGPDRAAGLSFADYVDDCTAIIDTLDAPPIVIGHSLGGLLALRLAELGRVRAVVAIASAPPGMLTAQAIALPKFAPKLPKIMSGRPFVVGNDACSVLALNEVPEAQRPAIHAHLTHESGRVYRSLMLGTVRVKASAVTVPVFVGGGDRDHIVSTRLVRKTARHFGVEPHIYPGHGHWLIEEPGWESIVDDVVGWLGAELPSLRV